MDNAELFNTETGDVCWFRRSDSKWPTILFLHGLGDSRTCFKEAFESSLIRDFNLVAPDLLGYGDSQSETDTDYSFGAHLDRLGRLLKCVPLPCERVFVVGHSLGGDLATHMAASMSGPSVCGLVNVEGNLTCDDLFISREAVAAGQRNDFDNWLRFEFREKKVLKEWAREWHSCDRYYYSLAHCQNASFLANAVELCDRNKLVPGGIESQTGQIFRLLTLPKLFCWGRKSLSDASQALLNGRDLHDKELPNEPFEKAFHWVMIDKSEEFYRSLGEFCRSHY